MPYQDKWIKGAVGQKGYRECAQRYEIIRAFCAHYTRPFTVCDIGSNWNYFGIRLTSDFPNCHVIAFEYSHYAQRLAHLRANKTDRVLLLCSKLRVADLRLLARATHFDLVLALSVIHHMSGTFAERLNALRGLGDSLIVEFAVEDSPRVDYSVPAGAILGYGESHKRRGVQRPIMLFGEQSK